jgi:hypothetical protein
MCQTNEKFIAILNRMWKNNQTFDDLKYINSSCMQPASIEPNFPYLFYKNKDVAAHNKYILSLILGNCIIINSIDLEKVKNGK